MVKVYVYIHPNLNNVEFNVKTDRRHLILCLILCLLYLNQFDQFVLYDQFNDVIFMHIFWVPLQFRFWAWAIWWLLSNAFSKKYL